MASTIPLPRQQRLLQLLRLAEGELSAQELHQRLRDAQQGTGLATVYRGLKLLQQAGLVRCRKLSSGETVYAPLNVTIITWSVCSAAPASPYRSAPLALAVWA